MVWINESYDPMLLLGSDDGVVKVWKDTSFSDSNAHRPNGGGNDGMGGNAGGNPNNNITSSNIAAHGSSPYPGSSSVELATAFSALPDIAETSRGSGIVVSWQQTAGTLVVGGNSNTIRVWDLGREQNVRVFYTGVETCLTAMATNTVSSSAFTSMGGSSSLHDIQSALTPDLENTPVTWTFAGFADGSIAVYDERVQSNGGRVHYSHTHGNWVNYAHLRADVPEVVIGSVRGTVKFWDLRTMRTYKTLEVQKSPLTSLTVHNCAPIMAAGSHAQFIKILTLSGEQLGNVIKYYDGFLGQRIGPVSSLAFHPHKLLLGASSTDGIVSIYHASGEK
jgi:regulator-associated protein of mTOR